MCVSVKFGIKEDTMAVSVGAGQYIYMIYVTVLDDGGGEKREEKI